jgi:hypothetical protein
MENETKIVAVGNCQAYGMAQCTADALGADIAYVHPTAFKSKPADVEKAFSGASLVLASTGRSLEAAKKQLKQEGQSSVRLVAVPRIFFNGFHPDAIYPSSSSAERRNPLGNCNSALLLAAWREELPPEAAIGLFRDEVFGELGFYEAFPVACEALLQECEAIGLDASPLIERWAAAGTFMYQPLHPHLPVLRDIAGALLERENLWSPANGPLPLVADELARNAIWPVYPEIGQRLGVPGDYLFRPKNTSGKDRPDLAPMDLESFVERSYAVFADDPPGISAFERLTDPRFADIKRFVKLRSAKTPRRETPYSGLADFHWWSKAVAEPEMTDVDPVVRPKFTISETTSIATAGSCFAQHIARRLQKENYRYLVTESAPAGHSDPAADNYGTFTARYGNIYTTRQLVQLVDRAYGRFVPELNSWRLADGGYVDPFRPRIGKVPFRSEEQLEQDRSRHFAAVREMFEILDVFVFTLGLTEHWAAKSDGAVVPLPPGVVGADTPGDAYAAGNLSVAEVISDLERFLDQLLEINRQAKVLLTVSPVPLIATIENQHVLTASTYSKSALRCAAGEVSARHDHVAYFPSYEIISGSFNRGAYFADDLREVTQDGVDHVMRLFMKHYAGADAASGQIVSSMAEIAAGMDIICDEEAIVASETETALAAAGTR